MKKRLLFAFMAICASVSSFALSQGDFVYTPQGRFQITGENLNKNNAFQSMDGWTVIGEGKTLAEKFNTNANGLADGLNSVVSLDATAGEGMYFKFVPTDASASYVVSFKMKGAALDNVKIRIPGDGYKKEDNLVKVAGNTANAYTYPATEEEVIVNTAEELTENWQTFNYAIQGDGTARTWFISFTTMATTIEIADLQIAPALQFADLRQRNAMLEKLNAYKNCYEWPAEVLADMGYDEAIENLQAIGDESGQAELDEQLATAQEILDEFIKANMDDYLAGNTDNYLGIKTTDGNTQKVSNYGDWTATTTGRAFWNNGAYPDLGHYAGNSAWNWNDTESPMGVYMQKTLDPGSYVFSIESNAALREDATSSSWTNNDGWNPAYGVAYIVKVVGETTTDTIASQVKDLESVNFTPFIIAAKIESGGTYEIGFKAYCKDAYKDLKNGSVTYVKDASLWGKNNNKYNQKQLAYEENVRTQITTGRTNIDTAVGYLDNASYAWGKADLEAVVNEVEPKIMEYEAMSQDEIIATYDEDTYENSTSNEAGLLQYTVYQEATKLIIAANRQFLAVNDTLNSLQVAIDNAEAVKVMRLYDSATGNYALQTAINTAEDVLAQMKAGQYSEENAAAIVAAIETLNEAVATFKNSIPATAIATLVDIDFEQEAVLNEETQLYSISGATGTMEFDHFKTTAPEGEDAPYEKGLWSNGEQKWAGYLRVGNGTGTVLFDPIPAGADDMGTNILKISCDFFIQGLNNRSIGFYLKDAEDNDVSGLYYNYYQGTATYSPFEDADMSKVWAKSGGSYNDASPAGVEEETANPLQKTNFEVIMDYGSGKMYVNISSPNGSTTSQEVEFTGVPVKFVLQSNYDDKFATRRAWFDNLKIERITAGEYVPQGPVFANFADGNYYFINVSSEKSWGAGNSWGTQGSLVNHPEYVTLHKQEDGTYFMETQVSNGGESYYFGGEYMDGSPVALTITQGEELGIAGDGTHVYAYYVTADGTNYYGWDGTENTVLARTLAAGDEKAQWLIVPAEKAITGLEAATAEDPMDATFLLLDPNFGRNNRNKSAWTGDDFGVGGDNTNMNAEKWGGNSQTFDISQTVDAPNGKYKISWNGFYRYNNTADNTNDIAVAAHADGTEVINSFVYINGKDYALTSIADDAASAALEGKLPFSQGEASAAFAQGLYAQSAEVIVTDGKLTIGIKKTEHPGTDWTVWDNFEIEYYGAAAEPVVDPDELIANGNCEGNDAGCLVVKNGEDGGAYSWKAVEGAGIDGSKAAVVHATSTAVDEWDAQFFIYAKDHVFALGEKFKLTFWVRADKAAQADLQAHSTPGNYIGWYIDGFSGPLEITTEWKEVVIEGTISDAMEQYGGVMNGMQTVAFNLNKDKTLENNYYFDNISWKLVSDDTAVETVKTVNAKSDAIYNLAGQKVDASYKGVVIVNGKKVLKK